MNPWTEIPLTCYESHMKLPAIGQAEYLAQRMGDFARMVPSRRTAVLGCAGGNGFDQLISAGVIELIGVDINREYGDFCFERYCEKIEHLEVMTADFCDESCRFDSVEFLFAGLFFEYVDWPEALKKCAELIIEGGYLAVVIQLPCSTMAEISPSPYADSLAPLASVLSLVDPIRFEQQAETEGFTLHESQCDTLESGKSFKRYLFKRDAQAAV